MAKSCGDPAWDQGPGLSRCASARRACSFARSALEVFEIGGRERAGGRASGGGARQASERSKRAQGIPCAPAPSPPPTSPKRIGSPESGASRLAESAGLEPVRTALATERAGEAAGELAAAGAFRFSLPGWLAKGRILSGSAVPGANSRRRMVRPRWRWMGRRRRWWSVWSLPHVERSPKGGLGWKRPGRKLSSGWGNIA